MWWSNWSIKVAYIYDHHGLHDMTSHISKIPWLHTTWNKYTITPSNWLVQTSCTCTLKNVKNNWRPLQTFLGFFQGISSPNLELCSIIKDVTKHDYTSSIHKEETQHQLQQQKLNRGVMIGQLEWHKESFLHSSNVRMEAYSVTKEHL